MHVKHVLWEIFKRHIVCTCVTKLLDETGYSNLEITDHDIVYDTSSQEKKPKLNQEQCGRKNVQEKSEE